MSYYRFTNSTTLGGKYVSNWGSGFNPQKYRWKRWSNSTGYDMFIPENSSSERSTVHNYLQNVSGVSRTVAWFGSADGRIIVTSVARSANGFYCHYGVPPTGDSVTYGYNTSVACPGGTVDRFGSKYGDQREDLSESQDNPYYNANASSNVATSFYLSYRYTNSSQGSENVYDYYINYCTNPTFPYRAYQIRHCYIEAQRGRCWDQCGNSVPAVVETLVIGGGGGGGASYREYWPGGNQRIPIFDDDGNLIGWYEEYVDPYDYIYRGGGGGAGGFRTANATVEVDSTYSVVVGAGGSGGYSTGTNGGTSYISGSSSYNSGNTVSIYAQGGGGGGYGLNNGSQGGSGGGGGAYFNGSSWSNSSGGAGNTSPQQGNAGSTGGSSSGGGGGGAGESGGTDGSGHGGDGLSSSISGTSTNYSGGGAGTGAGANGGFGGGGNSLTGTNGTAGTANTGGGGGAGGDMTQQTVQYIGGNGGSGVVFIRYPDFLANASTVTGSPEFSLSGGYRIYKFTGSGSLKWLS